MLRVLSLSVLLPTAPVKDRFLPTLPTIPVLFPIGIIASNSYSVVVVVVPVVVVLELVLVTVVVVELGTYVNRDGLSPPLVNLTWDI